MADNLTDTEGLRLIAWSLEGGNVKMADECRRAAAEIERLREVAEAADRYHDVACNPDGCRLCRALQVWKEARRG